MVEPADLGLPQVKQQDIGGGDTVEESARIFLNILEGKGTVAQNAVVVANAGMALYCANQKAGLDKALEKAKEALGAGKALQAFRALLNQ
jgi:anthranilate phosphoribosyltransferase